MPTVAIISDTHLPSGRRALPRECIERLRAADLIVHAGDFSAASVLRELEAFGPPVAAVHGNVEEPDLARLLPARREIEVGGARLGVVHDAGPSRGRLARMRAAFPTCDGVIFGHSHIPLHEQRDSFHIFNPGSPTDPRRQPRPTMGIAHVAKGNLMFEIVPLGSARSPTNRPPGRQSPPIGFCTSS